LSHNATAQPVIYHKGDDNRKPFSRRILFEVKSPDFYHVLKHLKGCKTVRVAFMLKQHVQIGRTLGQIDFVQEIGKVFFQFLFDKTILDDFYPLKIKVFQDFLWQITGKKTLASSLRLNTSLKILSWGFTISAIIYSPEFRVYLFSN
jgi:hypothetical protein